MKRYKCGSSCLPHVFHAIQDQANLAVDQHEFMKDAYMVMDHGTAEERLKMLERFKLYFQGDMQYKIKQI
jgi:hypothetical protein